MAEVRMRTFEDLEGDLSAIMGDAMECLDYDGEDEEDIEEDWIL